MSFLLNSWPLFQSIASKSMNWLLEKEMATHSSIPAWEIPWTEDPGRLRSVGLQKSQTYFTNEHALWTDSHQETGKTVMSSASISSILDFFLLCLLNKVSWWSLSPSLKGRCHCHSSQGLRPPDCHPAWYMFNTQLVSEKKQKRK